MPRKKKARPAIECITTRPPACPKCNCTDRTKKGSVIRRDIGGVLQPGNIEYTAMQWNYCNCKDCGQRYKFIEYLKPASRTREK